MTDFTQPAEATAWFEELFVLEPEANEIVRQVLLGTGYGPVGTDAVAELAGRVVAERSRSLGADGAGAVSSRMPGWPTAVVEFMGRPRLTRIEHIAHERIRLDRERDLPAWAQQAGYDPNLAGLLFDIAHARPGDEGLTSSISLYFSPALDPGGFGALTSTLNDVIGDPEMDLVERNRLLTELSDYALEGGSERVGTVRAAAAVGGGAFRAFRPTTSFRANSTLSASTRQSLDRMRSEALLDGRLLHRTLSAPAPGSPGTGPILRLQIQRGAGGARPVVALSRIATTGSKKLDGTLAQLQAMPLVPYERMAQLKAYFNRRGVEVWDGAEGARGLDRLGHTDSLGAFIVFKDISGNVHTAFMFRGQPTRRVVHHELWHRQDFLRNNGGDFERWRNGARIDHERYVHERLTTSRRWNEYPANDRADQVMYIRELELQAAADAARRYLHELGY